MRKSLMAKFLILCILLIVGAVFHILNVPELIEEFVKFIAVIVVLIMIKQVFDYLHGKREWYYLKYKGFSKKIVELK